jgi:hypothetical protein
MDFLGGPFCAWTTVSGWNHVGIWKSCGVVEISKEWGERLESLITFRLPSKKILHLGSAQSFQILHRDRHSPAACQLSPCPIFRLILYWTILFLDNRRWSDVSCLQPK